MIFQNMKAKKWSMKKKLIIYMLILASILMFALFSGIVFFGRFNSVEKNVNDTLDLQIKVFEKDVSSYFEALAASSIELSQFVSDHIDSTDDISGENFKSLTDNPQRIEALQTALITPLTQRLQGQNCSGIFVMLDATVNSGVEDAALSRTGLYLHHSRYQNNDDVILFRGNSQVGKVKNIMPHRKWRLEFRVDMFPSYDEVTENRNKPLKHAYILTESTTLSGTSDKVVMMAIPIVGNDGSFYGVCGYEISSEYFTAYHAQPSTSKRLSCIILDNKSLPFGLSCSGQDNHVQPLEGQISKKNIKKGLTEFSDGEQSFIGKHKYVQLTPNNSKFTLACMIPESDYKNAVIESTVQIVILIVLLIFFAGSCCVYFSKRYLSPLMKSLEQIKKKSWQNKEINIPEISDLFDYLAKQDEEHLSEMTSVKNELNKAIHTIEEAQRRRDQATADLEQAQKELSRLSYSRKTEVDPDNYKMFLDGLKTLTATENQILIYYIEGKTVKQIIELTGVKESTIRFHNRNIYSKLNVNSLKQLLLYAAMANNEQ